MPFLTVDRERCAKDGVCVDVCPVGALRRDQRDGSPVAVDGAQEICISCGHCVSVCPRKALALESVPLEQCVDLPAGWNLSPDQVEMLLKGRRSIRSYKPEPVGRQVIEKLVETARYAPSGVNAQPVRWAVLYDREKVARLAEGVVGWMRGLIAQGAPVAKSLRLGDIVAAHERGKDRICRAAPHLAYTYALKEDMLAAQASVIALTFFDLAAVSAGLGACWAGYVQMALNASDECRAIAGMNSRCACFGAMLFGYPAVAYYRIPPRNKVRIHFK